jgi:truncated hemoglobin YjbI
MTTAADRIRHRDLHRLLGWDKVETIVRDFYHVIAADPVVGHYFRALPDLDAAATRIARFWWRDLGGPPIVSREIFNPHAVHHALGIRPGEVDIWLELFLATLDRHLPPELAQPWAGRARKFAQWTRSELALPRRLLHPRRRGSGPI